MTGFLVFIGIVVAIVLLFRYWRKRELEAFLEADMSVFENFRTGERGEADRIPSGAQAVAANVVGLPAAGGASPPGPRFQLREALFDEVHRRCLRALEEVVGDDYRLFIHVPLGDLIRSDDRESQNRLKGGTISFLLCDKSTLSVICGIQLKGAGQSEAARHAFIEDVFRQIDKPLVTLPMLSAWSPLELREALAPALEDSPLARHCPRCGKEMMMRKAIRGKNAGKTFWVCKEFPSCKGIMRIGRF